MKKKRDLSASLEDYIEAIHHIVNENHVARSKEIASWLEVSRASVTEALRALARKGLINYAPYEAITMTNKGQRVAKDVIFRHDTLKQFFIEVLAIDRETAEEAACRIEHAAPPEVITRMISFIQFMQYCPRGGENLVKRFTNFCAENRTRTNSNKELLTVCFEQNKDHDSLKI